MSRPGLSDRPTRLTVPQGRKDLPAVVLALQREPYAVRAQRALRLTTRVRVGCMRMKS